MKPTPRTYYVRYRPCIGGYRLHSSRTGNGPWRPTDEALPKPVAESFDRSVRRYQDAELAIIYEKLFAGGDTQISGAGYRFTVTGKPNCVLVLKGEIVPAAQPLNPVPAALMKAAKAASTGRWRWDKAHLCITGKDADLDPWGYQAAELLGVRSKTLHCVAHIGKTFAGDDVCLNLTKKQETIQYEEALKLYLDQAGEIVCGCGMPGEWSGDDWFMSEQAPFAVRLRGDNEATVAAIRRGVERALSGCERELRIADKIMSQLAGWRDADGKHCPEGEPCAGSVSDMLSQMET